MVKRFYKVLFLAFLSLLSISAQSMQNFKLIESQKLKIADLLRTGNCLAARELLKLNGECFSVNTLDQIGKEAVKAGTSDVLEICLEFIAKKEKPNIDQFMEEAIKAEKLSMVKFLLAQGADRIQAKQRAEQTNNPNQAIIKAIKEQFSFRDHFYNNHYLFFLGGLTLLELLIVKGYLSYTETQWP